MSGPKNWNPDTVFERISQAGEHWADAEDKANRLEARAKRTYSALVISALEEAGSVSKAEHLARSSAAFERESLEAEQAKHTANVAKARLEAARTWWEAVRTMEATARAEANLR